MFIFHSCLLDFYKVLPNVRFVLWNKHAICVLLRNLFTSFQQSCTVLCYRRICASIQPSANVCPSQNVTYNKQLDLEAILVADVHFGHVSQIFVQIVSALDLHFQGQRLESSTMGNSYANDMANIIIVNEVYYVWFRFSR